MPRVESDVTTNSTPAAVRGWWSDVALVMVVALVAERILHEAVNAMALSSSVRAWADALGLAVILGPLLGWTLYRRGLEAGLAPRHTVLASAGRSPHRAVRIAVLASLCVFCGVAIMGVALERSVIVGASLSGELVNVTGRQRLLSQQVAHVAETVARSPEAPAKLWAYRDELESLGNEANRLRRLWLDTVRVDAEWRAAESVRLELLEEMSADPLTSAAADRIHSAAQRLLVAQNSYVAAIARVSGEGLRELAAAQRRFQIALLVLLVGIALLVIEPTVRLLARQHAENDALSREHQRLAIVAQRTSSSVIITDAEGRVVWANDACMRLTGYSLEELLGQSPLSLLQGPDTDSRTVAEIRAAIAERRSTRVVLLHYRKDGSPYWTSTSIEPLSQEGIASAGFIAVESDITELIEAQRALAADRAVLQRLAAQLEEAQTVAGVGNWEFDLQTQQVSWSVGTYRLFGLDPNQGLPTMEQVLGGYAPAAAERLQAAIGESLAFGTPYSLVLETSGRAPDVRYVRGIGRTRLGPAGKVTGLYGTVADITASVEIEAELELARRRAESASLSKSEFLANMSHEIRTPLTVILGFTDLLRDEFLQRPGLENQLNTIGSIRRAGEHLLSIINDILDISKIEAGRMQVETVDTDLSSLFRDVESLLRPRAVAKGIDLELRVLTPLPRHAPLDPTRVRQILVNLVGNAVKFTDKGEVRVEVSVVRTDGQDALVVGVRDTGIGMTAEQAVALFMPFVQADNSVTRRFGGTGLGLTISRRLAGLMGGEVVLSSSEPGTGSRFEFRLPLQSVDDSDCIEEFSSAVSHPKGMALATDALAGRRILLAEDGRDNQVLIKTILEASGAEVHIADNGRIALDIALRTVPPADDFDLVLTDMQMPEMDGYTLARQLRSRGANLPVIALTANAMSEDRLRCLEAGCSDYATKPIDRVALIETCVRWALRDGGRLRSEAPAALISTLANNPLIGNLVKTFAAALPDRATAIAQALQRGDTETVRVLAHQLRGAAGSYGYSSISTQAGILEDALATGDLPTTTKALASIAMLADAARRGLAEA